MKVNWKGIFLGLKLLFLISLSVIELFIIVGGVFVINQFAGIVSLGILVIFTVIYAMKIGE